MIRASSRLILRAFGAVCLWWLAVVPGFTDIDGLFIALMAVNVIAALSLVQRRFQTFFNILFFASLLGLLAKSFPNFVFTPVIWGLIFPVALAASIYLGQSVHEPDRKIKTLEQSAPIPELSRAAICLVLWAVGLLIIACSASSNVAIIVMGWTCLMLVLLRTIWTFSANREWYGYKMRRQIFVSRKRWIVRFCFTFMLICAFIASCLYIFQ